MPLRVAEWGDWLVAVNGCGVCPYLETRMVSGVGRRSQSWGQELHCNHEHGKKDVPLLDDRIPIWCPLGKP